MGEPEHLAMRDQYALQMPDELSGNIVTVEEPPDWLAPLYNPVPILNIDVGSITRFLI